MSVVNENYGGEGTLHVLVQTQNEYIDWRNGIDLPGDWVPIELESAEGDYNTRVIYIGSLEYKEQMYDALLEALVALVSDGEVESYSIVDPHGDIPTTSYSVAAATANASAANKENLGLARLYMPYRTIPNNATNAISFEEIAEGQEMVNFHDEAARGRYYTRDSYNRLRGRNPFTRKNIDPRNAESYRARFKSKGGKRSPRMRPRMRPRSLRRTVKRARGSGTRRIKRLRSRKA